MKQIAHRIVPITAKIKVIVRDNHIWDKTANSQKSDPHIKDAIGPIEKLLIRIALANLLFPLINPHLLLCYVPKQHPTTMLFK
jgi:hypothetical protein